MKKMFFSLIVGIMVVIVVEFMAQLSYFFIFGVRYNPSDLKGEGGHAHQVVDNKADERIPKRLARMPIHPYLGYVMPVPYRTARSHGLPNEFDPTTPIPDNIVSILLTGGSVAAQLRWGDVLEKTFNDEIKKNSRIERVRIYFAALGGYKQPQQLLAMNYLLSLDAEFDIVVNLDGFNDIVLPYVDNGRIGVNPFYPRGWAGRIHIRSNRVDPLIVGEIAWLRGRQQALVTVAVNQTWANSALVGLIMRFRLEAMQRDIAGLERDLQALQVGLDFEAGGPLVDSWEQAAVLEMSADIWQRASIVMARELRGLGIEYYHFLQPNQYLAGSKPLSVEEKSNFYRPEQHYGQNAAKGYPLLLERAGGLTSAGVNYVDATRIFAAEEGTVYKDTCCHLNSYGNQKLADFIVKHVMSRTKAFVQRQADL